MVEDVVCHFPALGDARGLVEVPMDTKVYSALAIFFFGLRKGREATRHVGTNVAIVILGHAVEFIGNKSESDVIRSIKTA
jgi:hypothetical protein